MLTNARSLTSTIDDLELLMSKEKYGIVGISETKLDYSYDWAVNFQGYSFFRKDRKYCKTRGLPLSRVLSKARTTGRYMCREQTLGVAVGSSTWR